MTVTGRFNTASCPLIKRTDCDIGQCLSLADEDVARLALVPVELEEEEELVRSAAGSLHGLTGKCCSRQSSRCRRWLQSYHGSRGHISDTCSPAVLHNVSFLFIFRWCHHVSKFTFVVLLTLQLLKMIRCNSLYRDTYLKRLVNIL